MEMQAQTVCSGGRVRSFSLTLSPFIACFHSRKEKGYTPAYAGARSFQTRVCLSSNGQRNQKAMFHGRRVWVFASGGFPANGNGASYLSAPQAAAAEGNPDYSVEARTRQFKEQPLESGHIDLNSSEEMRTVLSAGSPRWILAPTVLMASLLLPQIFIPGAIEAIVKDEVLCEIVASFASETVFYIGLTIFLSMAEHLQQPYLSLAKYKWGLITNHRSYLYSDYLTMGIKVFAPLLAANLIWPAIGLPAVVAIAPFLVGLAVQFVLEESLARRKLSCWPLLTIIFELYRLYQLNKGAHFVERLMLSMRRSAMQRDFLDKGSALVSMVVVFQVLGVVCLWSLTTFLLRLLPAKTVQEKL